MRMHLQPSRPYRLRLVRIFTCVVYSVKDSRPLIRVYALWRWTRTSSLNEKLRARRSEGMQAFGVPPTSFMRNSRGLHGFVVLRLDGRAALSYLLRLFLQSSK